MCFAEDALVESQLSLGTPASLPRDQVVGNPLSLYSCYLAPQAQHAPSAHDETIIQALKNIQDDKPKEKEEQPLHSLFFDSGILQPFEVGAGNELKPKTSPPMTRTTRSTSRMLLTSSQKFMNRRQTTFWDRRGVLPGLQPSTLLL
jgi:hypothetical protein